MRSGERSLANEKGGGVSNQWEAGRGLQPGVSNQWEAGRDLQLMRRDRSLQPMESVRGLQSKEQARGLSWSVCLSSEHL